METTSEETEAQPMIYMRFRPAWAYIDGIREFGKFFCETTYRDEAAAERARTVLQESLENAVKYSTEGPGSELELCIMNRGAELEIAVTSLPDPGHLGSLRDEIERINATDPEQAFHDAMVRAAEAPENAARLGLARMRLEGNVRLSVENHDDGRIRVTARGVL
jgi:hypothetical protein